MQIRLNNFNVNLINTITSSELNLNNKEFPFFLVARGFLGNSAFYAFAFFSFALHVLYRCIFLNELGNTRLLT